MAELGYVGLGVMGGGVVRRLLDAGHTVDRLEPDAGEGRAAARRRRAVGREPARASPSAARSSSRW